MNDGAALVLFNLFFNVKHPINLINVFGVIADGVKTIDNYLKSYHEVALAWKFSLRAEGAGHPHHRQKESELAQNYP